VPARQHGGGASSRGQEGGGDRSRGLRRPRQGADHRTGRGPVHRRGHYQRCARSTSPAATAPVPGLGARRPRTTRPQRPRRRRRRCHRRAAQPLTRATGVTGGRTFPRGSRPLVFGCGAICGPPVSTGSTARSPQPRHRASAQRVCTQCAPASGRQHMAAVQRHGKGDPAACHGFPINDPRGRGRRPRRSSQPDPAAASAPPFSPATPVRR
jgi:hypothetical protein